jgi:pimeloyl-ACP methyl ester carboxylesterase
VGDVSIATGPGGAALAYREDGGEDVGRCGFFFLGGFMSDMQGAKAETLASLARDTRRLAFRFDYSGHGASEGLFVDGTISLWLQQAIHKFTRLARGRRIVIGSSMGGWLALLLYRHLQRHDSAALKRIAGLVLIAPAADMTSDLMWSAFSAAQKAEMAAKGVVLVASRYGPAYPVTARLIADGDSHLLLADGLECTCPVRILQGDADEDVPSHHAFRVFAALNGSDIAMTLIKGGDHRLSAPGQLALLRETVLRLAERADGLSV